MVGEERKDRLSMKIIGSIFTILSLLGLAMIGYGLYMIGSVLWPVISNPDNAIKIALGFIIFVGGYIIAYICAGVGKDLLREEST